MGVKHFLCEVPRHVFDNEGCLIAAEVLDLIDQIEADASGLESKETRHVQDTAHRFAVLCANLDDSTRTALRKGDVENEGFFQAKSLPFAERLSVLLDIIQGLVFLLHVADV